VRQAQLFQALIQRRAARVQHGAHGAIAQDRAAGKAIEKWVGH
jgi:hypothetical protein